MIESPALSRRSFLKVVGGVGTAFALGCYSVSAEGNGTDGSAAFAPNAFLRVDPDGTVTVTVSKSDMGQGVRTTIAMIVAEELEADWSKVKVIQAAGDSAVFGGQGTGGSSTVRSMYQRMRQIGAGARMMLVQAAAQTWKVDASTCRAEAGKVINTANGKSLTYGELAGTAGTVSVPTDVPLKSKDQFKILGKATRRVDNRDVVTGKAQYAIDVRVDGMAYAVVSRRPAFGATVQSFDDAEARKVPGVQNVVKINSGVAVVASNTWAAIKGREALKVTWDPGPNTELSTATLRSDLKALIGAANEMPAGNKSIEAQFELPFLAHATMEPMNAVADVKDGQCTVWAGTQSPDGAQVQVARALGLTNDKVKVNTMLLGGGFGRRFNNDFLMEAVMISKAAGRPIKLLWTRDDDLGSDSFRPMSHHALKANLDNGNPVGWSHQLINAGGRGSRGGYGRAGIPYAIPNSGMATGGAVSPIPTGPWRSVENSQINVVNECFVDELAVAAGKDPYEFRRGLINDDRLKRVLALAAEKGSWGKALPKGWGRGIACFTGYGSCAAHVVELEVKDEKIILHRVVIAVDPGTALNPLGVEAQMQGSCVDGLSTALHAAITIDKGKVVQESYFDYEWLHIDEMPRIEVHISESGGEPGGLGEVGYPSVMPAVANALFAATGKRVRKFPIVLSELV